MNGGTEVDAAVQMLFITQCSESSYWPYSLITLFLQIQYQMSTMGPDELAYIDPCLGLMAG